MFLGAYYINVNLGTFLQYFPFDEKGIAAPTVEGVPYYNGTTVSHQALSYYDLILTVNWKHIPLTCKASLDEYVNKFLTNCQWLVDNGAEDYNGCMVWFFPKPHGKIKAPWVSAMTQGLGISTLLRGFQLTGNEKFMEISQKAMKNLHIDIKDGGGRYEEDGMVYLEEYPEDKPVHVLNGFIYALWGVYDYMLVTGDKKAEKLFNDCVQTLVKTLDRYDNGQWSKYDQGPADYILGNDYHTLHIAQLNAMHNITGISIFKEYADKFNSYLSAEQLAKANLSVFQDKQNL